LSPLANRWPSLGNWSVVLKQALDAAGYGRTSWLALGLSQPGLARFAGIEREYLSMIERGRANRGLVTRARIKAALAQADPQPLPASSRSADQAGFMIDKNSLERRAKTALTSPMGI
jgi:hypothetical protein